MRRRLKLPLKFRPKRSVCSRGPLQSTIGLQAVSGATDAAAERQLLCLEEAWPTNEERQTTTKRTNANTTNKWQTCGRKGGKTEEKIEKKEKEKEKKTEKMKSDKKTAATTITTASTTVTACLTGTTTIISVMNTRSLGKSTTNSAILQRPPYHDNDLAEKVTLSRRDQTNPASTY
jgi:hypothetical protein